MTLKKVLQKSILPMPTPEDSARAAEEIKYHNNLWDCAEQIGIQPEEIEKETQRLKGLRKLRRGDDLGLLDITFQPQALENLIMEKTKNQENQDEFVAYVIACIHKSQYESKHQQEHFPTQKKEPWWKKLPVVYATKGRGKGTLERYGCDAHGFLRDTRSKGK